MFLSDAIPFSEVSRGDRVAPLVHWDKCLLCVLGCGQALASWELLAAGEGQV